MQIPKGDSFGNRTAQLRQTAIQRPSGDGGRGMVQGVDKLYTDLGASANLDAENALFDYQKKLDAANTQVVDLFAAREISDQDMALQHQKVVSDIPAPDFSHLSLNSEKRFLLEADKLRYSNKLKMAEGISQAQKERAKVSNQNCLANVTDQAYNGNIYASGAIQALDSNDAFQKNGEIAFGLDWESQKQANYQKLQSYYILGGINDANNTDQLKNIRTMLLEDNNEVNYLTPFARNKYIKQANSFIDMNVGRSYSNTLTTGVDQLVERTGDFSAVKAYSWLSNNQGEEGNRLETAKYIAGRLGLLFNQQQYNDNPNYVEQLKQSYFLDSLDQYGSPIVAGLAIKFGDKQINEWLEKIGDPSKGQLLESEFINNIPDKKAKQVALQISQQTDAKESNQSDIDLILANIDHNKDLNDTQKRIAKASVKQFMKEKQEAIQANYIETHKNIWSRLYVQGEPINQIDAKQWSSLNEADRKQILEPPPTQLNFPIYQEARGRIMAGTPVNLIKNYYDKIPSEQLKELIDLQETIKNDPARRDGVIKTSSMINSRIDAEGRLSDKNRYILNASISDEVEAFERKQGRVATPKEILYIVDKQFVLMKLDDGVFFDTKKPYYQMTKEELQRAKVNSVSDIPPKELRKVKDALKIKKLSVTDENILDVYTRRLKND